MKTISCGGTTANPAEQAETPWRRSFWSLIVTQFQGALSDTALKNLVIFLILGMGLPQEKRDTLVPLVGALFAIPFILFSMAGGYLADRFSKCSVTIGVKVFEMGVMLFAAAALLFNSLPMELTAVFFMGVHSAIFSPSKYGLLPEVLPEKRLSWGNGIIELTTFLAIILGTTAGAFLAETFQGRQVWSGFLLFGLAMLGWFTSQNIERVPAANPQRAFRANFIADLRDQMRLIRKDRILWLAVLGNTYFFALAALLQMNIVIYGKDVLHLGDLQNGYLQIAIAVGIGAGSVLAGYLSSGKIEYGLIPLGSLGMTALAMALGVPGLSFGALVVCLAVLGVFGGLFIVPIAALLQHRPDKEAKGGVLAAASLLSWIGILLAAGVYWVLTAVFHLTAGGVFLASAFITLAGTVYVLCLLPDALARLVCWMLAHTLYRVRVEGRENLPTKGGALLVCNHLSFVDALLLMASTDRKIRFLLLKEYYELPWVKPFVRLVGVLPISSNQRPREMIQSLRTATEAIRRGEIVCIFAEGQITRTGQMLPFRRGFERIMKGLDAPIVPVCLDGVWGSIFSFAEQRFYWKLPRRIPYPVSVSYGKPMPATTQAFEVRQEVQQLQSASWSLRKPLMQTLPRAFVASARRRPFRFAMADAKVRQLRFGAVLTRTVFLAQRLRRVWQDQEMIGVLLPPSIGGALVNHAALLAGKVPVNLNYTLSPEALAACVRQCGIRTIITSQAFLDKLQITLPGEVVLLEQVAAQPRMTEQVLALVRAWLLPVRLLEQSLGRVRPPSLDDLATVIFSSGSTGDPKGVMLTHHNLAANVEQLGQVFPFQKRDRLLGVLPFFHSFGFTGTLCLPAVLGVGVAYHPNPIDGRGIANLVRERAVTFMVATPTFLQMYLRAAQPEDFGSLRLVMAGAEKLPERVAAAFEEKFGIRPVEAYGCTECAPAVTVNTLDYRAPGFRQAGGKRGRIGHPLPGIGVRIVDPETFQPLPVGKAGLFLVRGPNVMAGYLGRPEATAQALREGWYVTGDIAALDEDGFVQITDRLSRFSKIGGEMVPHIKVEEKLHELAGVTVQSFAVAGVPDERKGERLVVLHTLPDNVLIELLASLPRLDLPNLWIPRGNQFFRVPALPYLGTGKLDLRRVRELAQQPAA